MENYVVTKKDKEAIRALFDMTDEKVKVKMEILKKWIGECPSLPLEAKEETFLERVLLNGKFNEENVKKIIENYFKYLPRYPDFFSGISMIRPSEEIGVAVPLPKLTPSWERVVILKLSPKKFTGELDVLACFREGLSTGTITFHQDFAPSCRLILDFEGFTARHIAQTNISDVYRVVMVYENILKIRISGIEILSAPHLLSAVLAVARAILKPKLFSRITVHGDLDSLHKNVSKEYLPKDYGGDLRSIEEFIDIWDRIFVEQAPLFERIEKFVDSHPHENDLFGVRGSFRTLAVD